MKKSGSKKSMLPPYQKSLRYIANAEESLKKAGRDAETGEYADKKYVRTASGIAYLAVLIALDEYLQRKEGLKLKKPKSIEEYRTMPNLSGLKDLTGFFSPLLVLAKRTDNFFQ